MTRTIDLGRHIQGMEGRWRDRFDELTARLERQTSRPSPDRDAAIANRDRPDVDAPRTQDHERAQGSNPRASRDRQRRSHRPRSAADPGAEYRRSPRVNQRVPSQAEHVPGSPPTDSRGRERGAADRLGRRRGQSGRQQLAAVGTAAGVAFPTDRHRSLRRLLPDR